MELLFKDVTVSLCQQTVLAGVSGFCRPGEILAIMGPTGSGKTTLLNVLAGRLCGMERGKIYLDGHPFNKSLKRKIVYVLQQDIFLSNLTVRQTLRFMALLRLPDVMPYEDKMQRVDEIVNTLDLRKCLDVRIGDSITGGLSGGEKKLANIGIELLTNPELMYIDEPTTGLDSSHAYDMMTMLKMYTGKERKTVIVTIHQPSSQIFHMFDKVLLLSDGQVAYFGETCKILSFFSGLGLHCAPHYNPADFIMEVVAADQEMHEKVVIGYLDLKETQEEFKEMDYQRFDSVSLAISYDQPELGDTESVLDMYYNMDDIRLQMAHRFDLYNKRRSTMIDTKRQSKQLHSVKKFYEDYYDEKWPTCFWTQYSVLTRRNFLHAQGKILSKWAAIQVVAVAVMAGLVWYQIERTEETLKDRKGILFFTVIYWMVNPMLAALTAFPEDREVLNKERSAGTYRLSAYYLAKLTSELPLTIVLPTLFLVIVFPMVGLNGVHGFFGMWICLMLNALAAEAFGLFAGAYFLNESQGITICVTVSLFYLMMGGFYAEHVPIWLLWGRYISPPFYSFEAFNILEFTNAKPIECAAKNSIFFECVNGSATHIDSDTVLETLDTKIELEYNMIFLFAYMVFFYVCAYLILRFARKPEQLLHKHSK